jgi:hypothetical protein
MYYITASSTTIRIRVQYSNPYYQFVSPLFSISILKADEDSLCLQGYTCPTGNQEQHAGPRSEKSTMGFDPLTSRIRRNVSYHYTNNARIHSTSINIISHSQSSSVSNKYRLPVLATVTYHHTNYTKETAFTSSHACMQPACTQHAHTHQARNTHATMRIHNQK